MKRAIESRHILIALALILALGGCATDPAFRGPVEIASNREIVVVRAAAHQKPDGILVGGDVRRTNGYAGPVPGHLRVIGRDSSGRVVATTDASWGEFMNRRFRLAYFKAFLQAVDPAAIATVSIEPVTP